MYMKDSILRTKAIDFAANIVNFYNEATFGNSKAGFIPVFLLFNKQWVLKSYITTLTLKQLFYLF